MRPIALYVGIHSATADSLATYALMLFDSSRTHHHEQRAGVTDPKDHSKFRLHPDYKWVLADGPDGPTLTAERVGEEEA
jgi:hypothetical protein